MIDLDTAKEIASNLYHNEYAITSYAELTDSWCFGFMTHERQPIYGLQPVRVYKSTGEAEIWDPFRHNEEFFSKRIDEVQL